MTGWIDTHLHLWADLAGYSWLSPELAPLYREITPAEGLAASAKFNCQRALLVQAADTWADTEFLLETKAQHPQIAGVVGWVDLTDPALAERLPALQQRGLVGVRELIHDQPDPLLLDTAAYRAGLEVLAAAQLPFEIPDAFPAQFPAAIRLAKQLPQLTVILDHAGKPPAQPGAEFASWQQQLREFAACPNTVVKLSGLHHGGIALPDAIFARVWELVLELFGSQRVLLGSDYPMPLLGDGIERLALATANQLEQLSAADLELICVTNPERIYRLCA